MDARMEDQQQPDRTSPGKTARGSQHRNPFSVLVADVGTSPWCACRAWGSVRV